MSKLVSNPISKEISVIHMGTKYMAPANGKTIVPDEVAVFWKAQHAFIAVSDVVESKKEEVKEEPKEEVVEEVKAEDKKASSPLKEKKSKK